MLNPRPLKRCYICKKDKTRSEFRHCKTKTGTGLRSSCKKCDGIASGINRKRNRNAGLMPDKWICEDTKKQDKLKGRGNDLDRTFIREIISKPCTYCGESKLRRTLDRIDNSIGHIRTNVVSACIRCNYIRRDMPYEAWLVVAPAMCAANKAGLFKDWIPGPKKSVATTHLASD